MYRSCLTCHKSTCVSSDYMLFAFHCCCRPRHSTIIYLNMSSEMKSVIILSWSVWCESVLCAVPTSRHLIVVLRHSFAVDAIISIWSRNMRSIEVDSLNESRSFRSLLFLRPTFWFSTLFPLQLALRERESGWEGGRDSLQLAALHKTQTNQNMSTKSEYNGARCQQRKWGKNTARYWNDNGWYTQTRGAYNMSSQQPPET